MAGPAEWVRLNGQLVAVPSVVCERRPAFDAALSQAAWDTLADTQRDHLRVSEPAVCRGNSGRAMAVVWDRERDGSVRERRPTARPGWKGICNMYYV